MQYMFTMKATAGDVQAAIDQDNMAQPGYLIARVPWMHTRGYENVAPGDGAIIELDDPDDQTSWVGRVEDVQFEEGYDMEIVISVS